MIFTFSTVRSIALALFSLPLTVFADYEFVSSFGRFGTAVGQFDSPRGVAVDLSGGIVLTESGNHRVQICSDQGSCSAWGSFGDLSGQFDKPRGVAVNSQGRIIIADRGNDRIQRCTSSGSCTDFDGSANGVGPFESPRGVAITSQDRIVVTDTDNDRIQICTNANPPICTGFGSTGLGLGQFISPAGVAVDSRGRLIIADRGNDRIQICTEQGSCTAFGSFGVAPGQFDSPAGIAVDSQDRIIVVDRFNHRVQVCSRQGVCSAFGSFGSGNGQFNEPWGVAVDSQDRIIVADLSNHRVQIFADAPPGLTLIKNVINNNGGNAQASDFQLRLDGGIYSNSPFSSGDSPEVVANTLYTVSEDPLTGYTQHGSVSCIDNGDMMAVPHPVSLSEGQLVTCTISNDDQQPSLTLQKIVINDDGGNAMDSDWTLTATGPDTISGVHGDMTITAAAVDAGEYTLSESAGPDGYTAGNWSCAGMTNSSLNVDVLTLALAENVTCSITNNDDVQVNIISFTASPNPIEAGQSVLLSWSVANATQCTPLEGTPEWTSLLIDPSDGNASVLITLAGEYVFTLQCTDGNNTQSRSVTVTATAVVPDFQIDPGLNGNWWNGLERNGEGVQAEVADGGDGSLIFVVTIYTYNPSGEQIFLVAVGPVDGDSAEVDVFITQGGLWGENFDPALVNESQWGTGTFTASSCEAMHMSLRPNAEFQAMGYTNLMYDLIRLTTPSIACPLEPSN